MKQSLKQQVLNLCTEYGCTFTEYGGSHYVVAAKEGDIRTWITCSHSLTEYIDDKPNDALRELLYMMAQGFDNSGGCDDGDDCQTCRTTRNNN
jgi:trehalose-6-phosphatase